MAGKYVVFKDPDEMLKRIEDGEDFYNETTGIYVFRYNEKGSIAYYRLTNEQARNIANEAFRIGETMWSAVLGSGGYIIDNPITITGFCKDTYKDKGWLIADLYTF